ncbi:(2Fe-2S)-binding protein [Methylobacterium nonmethylotrophicum]|uniref:(2Fe-2S)-binding protein n=1 Tax=Methylobacterium nonmethylotrophicum TaxID=1141884 RepID=A0A4Z0NU25_9HYPH|nr:(2Fe-2S)-binding protein [Methylobacterium nonmethylotrophicum]TGE01005.1 (2Fe-2S)-binding protein [Methylobacterium nonmethylotrophicum]
MQEDRRPVATDTRLTPVRHGLHVNGRTVTVEVAPGTRLLYVLRNDLALNGPKYGCGLGQCGSCTVLVDGRALRSCAIPVRAALGRRIVTLEGLAEGGRLHPVQEAFVAENAAQCGYCLNGMIMTTVALLAANPDPSEAEIRAGLQANLCRCGTHIEILRAVRGAAARLRAGRADREKAGSDEAGSSQA